MFEEDGESLKKDEEWKMSSGGGGEEVYSGKKVCQQHPVFPGGHPSKY